MFPSLALRAVTYGHRAATRQMRKTGLRPSARQGVKQGVNPLVKRCCHPVLKACRFGAERLLVEPLQPFCKVDARCAAVAPPSPFFDLVKVTKTAPMCGSPAASQAVRLEAEAFETQMSQARMEYSAKLVVRPLEGELKAAAQLCHGDTLAKLFPNQQP